MGQNSYIIYIFIIIGFLVTTYKLSNIDKINNKLEKMEGTKFIVTGKIVTMPCEENNKKTFIIETSEVKGIKTKIKLQVYLNNNFQKIQLGDEIEVQGTFRSPIGFNNSGTFNYKKNLNYKNIYGSLIVENVTIKSKNKEILNHIKNKLDEKIKNNFNPKAVRNFRSTSFRNKTRTG